MVSVFIETTVFISACIQHTFSDVGIKCHKEISHRGYSQCKHLISLLSESKTGITSPNVINEADFTLSKAIASTIQEHESKHGVIEDREMQFKIAGELLRSAKLKKDEYYRNLVIVQISDNGSWQKIRSRVESFYRELRPDYETAKRESEEYAYAAPKPFWNVARRIKFKEAMNAPYSHLPSRRDKEILADAVYYFENDLRGDNSAKLYFASEDGNFVNRGDHKDIEERISKEFSVQPVRVAKIIELIKSKEAAR